MTQIELLHLLCAKVAGENADAVAQIEKITRYCI